MNIKTASLADIGRFVAARTANMDAAKIAHSSAPQIRYDAVIFQMLQDPIQYQEFTREERIALAQRIHDKTKRDNVLRELQGGKENENDKLKCPRCGGADIRHRIRTQDYWCRRCGHTWPVNKKG